jgi:Protein of unknown function (DUF2726)
MQQALPWITALGVLVVIAAGLALWATRPRQSSSLPLPNDWSVAPRAIFSVDERRAFRQLREAFPEHVVLAKLPLIRLCQPVNPREIRFWFELLGSIHVSFAICTPQGRVLAAIDLDGERPASRRTLQIKQGVLSACRIRHLRCTLEQLPSAAELKRLLPSGVSTGTEDLASPARGQVEEADGSAHLPRPESMFPTTLTRQDLELGQASTDRKPLPAQESAPAASTPLEGARSVSRPPERTPSFGFGKASSAEPSRTHVRASKERQPLWQDSGLFQDSFFGIENLRDAGPPSNFGSLLAEAARGRGTTSGPPISADPSQGVLESERAKLKQQGQR